ncbi:10242_t:CDS:2, partial [Acaulospora colombiana]
MAVNKAIGKKGKETKSLPPPERFASHSHLHSLQPQNFIKPRGGRALLSIKKEKTPSKYAASPPPKLKRANQRPRCDETASPFALSVGHPLKTTITPEHIVQEEVTASWNAHFRPT